MDRSLVVAAIVVVAFVLLVGSLAYAVVSNRSAARQATAYTRQIEHERARSMHQTCILFERYYNEAVTRVTNTYKYIGQLGPEERRTPLNRFVIANLSRTERDARLSVAPRYCNGPDVGLPEPPPKIPRRPRDLL
jgi:hypothetical protein